MKFKARRVPGSATPTQPGELAGEPMTEAEAAAHEAARDRELSEREGRIREAEARARAAEQRAAEAEAAAATAQAEAARERLARIDAESSGRAKFRALHGAGPWTLRLSIIESGEDHDMRSLSLIHNEVSYTLDQHNKRSGNKSRPFLFNPKRETRLKTSDRALAERVLSHPHAEVLPTGE